MSNITNPKSTVVTVNKNRASYPAVFRDVLAINNPRDFAAAVREMLTQKAVSSQFLCADGFEEMRKRFEYFYPVVSTRSNYYSKLRKLIKEVYDYPTYQCALDKLRITRQEFEDLNDSQKARRDETNSNRISISSDDINKLVHKLMGNAYFIENQIILAMLCSGARVGEILRKTKYENGNWEAPPDMTDFPQILKVSSISKKKNNTEFYYRPLLWLPLDDFQKLIEAIRTFTAGSQHPVNSYGTVVNNMVRQLFHNLIDHNDKSTRETSHLLRKIYGAVSYNDYVQYRNKDKKTSVSFNEWLRRIFGHRTEETSLNYTSINLLPPETK